MNFKCCIWEKFKIDIVKHEARLLLFGAGAIGQITTPEILKRLGVLDRIDCYLDNDRTKWGTYLDVCGKHYEVKSPDYLKECSPKSIILLNISRFASVITQLQSMSCTENMVCYVIPMMLMHNFCMGKSKGVPVLEKEALIPKKIHYMWLGRKAIPDNLKRCIESWEKNCRDYEILEWNEDNFDLGKNAYMKDAYNANAYGFVPDYARLDILYNEGGFYLDTDVEIIGSIDNLRHQQAFCGVEKWQILNFGGFSGAVKGHPMIKAFLDARANVSFYNDDGSPNRNTCGFYDTKVALQYGYKINGETQTINGMNIYAYDYFHSYDYMSGKINKTDNTYSIHWFNGGWLDESMKMANEEAKLSYIRLYKRALAGE